MVDYGRFAELFPSDNSNLLIKGSIKSQISLQKML